MVISKKLKDWRPFHARNIIREEVGLINKLEAGKIVRFNYKGEYATVKRPLVLILHPRYKNKMHAISLDNISDVVLKQLKDIVTSSLKDKIEKLIGLRLPLLKAEINDPQRFYDSKIKLFISTFFPKGVTPYRTYLVKNITNLRLIDYKFKDFYDGSTGEEDTVRGKTRER